MLTLLTRWARPRPKLSLAHLTFTVYTRAQCSCCHKALDLLDDYRRHYGFTVETSDVDADPALAARYGDSVPVVAVNGKVRFKGVVNPALLERLLQAEGRS
jgi:glutaredoxin